MTHPSLILVPRRLNAIELTDLCRADRYQLMDEMGQATQLIQACFRPEKVIRMH